MSNIGSSRGHEAVIVVSGLPRSGTSLVMQMLEAGGVPLLADDHRQPDESNPRGYFEFEAVKRLASDNSWVSEAQGKAVKIIAQLVPFLPAVFAYDFLFIQRNLEEVMDSQARMLRIQNEHRPRRSSLGDVFTEQLCSAITFAERIPKSRVLILSHHQLLQNPGVSAAEIGRFLGRKGLSINGMAQAIDPSLYRNRADTSQS